MYSTSDDIIKRLSQKELALLSSDSGETVDIDVVNTAITDADSVIDSYLKKAYSLPLNTVPNIIKKLSTELTIIFLNDKNTQNDEAIEVRRKNVYNLLEKIANKQIILGINEESQNKKFLYKSNTRLFKRGF